MNYAGFHAVFNVPLLLLLFFWAGPWAWPQEKFLALAAILGVVLVFTSVWDNYAVSKGIWDFSPRRIWKRVFYLPVEEYAFFWIQSLQVIFFLDGWLQRYPQEGSIAFSLESSVPGLLALGFGWAGIGFLGHRRWGCGTRAHYAWHLLFWFLPLILLQWIVGWGILLPRLGALLLPVAVLGTWLVYADFRAVQQGIWFFDEKQITGPKLLRLLPWEEIAFFYITSLIVAQTWLLLLPEGLR